MLEILLPMAIFILLGLVSGVLLTVFSNAFEVKADEKVEEIITMLPGLNCGVCGFPGCENYANEIVSNNVETNRCVPGGDETSKKISDVLGTEFMDVVETIAYVHCGGERPQATQERFEYQGEQTCSACNTFYEGNGKCSYGCLGLGDCINECDYDAISIIDNIAVIDPKKCVGCEKCVSACPKVLIELRDATKKVFIRCNSRDNGKTTISNCKKGCIGCGKCAKVCPTDAIIIENFLARIDYDKCINCLECAKVCPTKCIEVI